MYQKQLQSISQSLEAKINDVQLKLQELPEGTFCCARNGKTYKWYRYIEGEQSYISKDNRPLAEELAYKKFLAFQLNKLQNVKKGIDSCLENYNADIDHKLRSMLENPEYQALLAPYFQPVSSELAEWTNTSYKRNPNYTEQLLIQTTSGNLVRSKSEAMIDYCLCTYKIPFRYECALELGGRTIYPDFTIRHPETGKYYYWEHFGLMDDLIYANKACEKLKWYSTNGIVTTIQLITTYETKDHPLSMEVIEDTIKQYFL